MMNHVLVVKADRQWWELIREPLKLKGFWVTRVENIDDALSQATDIAPDLIVLDIDALAIADSEMADVGNAVVNANRLTANAWANDDSNDNSNLHAIAFCRQLKASPVSQAIPIVLCTSQPAVACPEWALAQGAQAGLQKPFGPDQLIAVLQHLV